MLRMETRLFAVASLLLPLSSRAFFFVSPPPSMIAMGKSRAKITATGTATATIMPKMRVSGIESTPNPSSFKFDLDEKMHGSSKGVTYTVKTGQGAPEPIQRVLELEGVESVYALGDWLCLNKAPSAKWDKIVPSAVEALGGAAESLDPFTLLMASSGGGGGGTAEGGEGSQRSEMNGITIRLQVSNGIPIQVEACPPGGTPLRRKLSSRFVEAMSKFVSASGDEMAFFKGRQWIPRGVRYPEGAGDDGDGDSAGGGGKGSRTTTKVESSAAEEALNAAAAEVELAYHESRLRGAVTSAVDAAAATLCDNSGDNGSGGQRGAGGSTGAAESAAAAAAIAAVRTAAAALQSSAKGEVIAAVETLCALAENANVPSSSPAASSGDDGGFVPASVARDSLDAIIGFTGSGEGPVAARRTAVAFVGGVGDAAGAAGLEAVAAVFRGDKNPGVRRTAGDALSDLGDPGGVSVAVAGLCDKSKLVRWRAARVVGELATREQEAASLDEAREGELEFEVAFEMADAARKIRSRIAAAATAGGSGDAAAAAGGGGKVPGAGPVWKQIQERSAK